MCVLEDIYKRHISDAPEKYAHECLDMGRELLSHGDYDRALVYFEQAYTHPQTAPEAFDGKLKALYEKQDYDSMQKSIDYALKIFPDDATAYNYQTLLYAKDEKWDQAIECCDKIISITPYSEDAYIAKSELEVSKGDYESAQQTAQTALEIYPESERANFQAAKACIGMKQYDKAVALFDKVVSINPQNAEAQDAKTSSLDIFIQNEKNELKLALTLLDHQMYADSLRHFENMIAQKGETAELYFFLGKVYKGLGDTPRMIESMQKSYHLAPYSTTPYIEIGEHLLSEGRERDAMEYFERVLDIDPNNRIANIKIGQFLRKIGLITQAEEHFDMVIKNDNADAEAFLLKGIAAIDRYPAGGNPMLYFDRAMEINPSYALPMYYRAKFQLISGQKKRHALESFNKAAFLASQSGDEILLEKCRIAIQEILAVRKNDDD